jgi:hypothetical protein
MLLWLTIIAHGQQDDPDFERTSTWMRGIAEEIAKEVDEAEQKSGTRSIFKLDLTSGSHVDTGYFNNAAEIRALAENGAQVLQNGTRRFVLVDWGIFVRDFCDSPDIADEIGARLGLFVGGLLARMPEITDVHFIGFSRGSFVVNTAIGILSNADDLALSEANDAAVFDGDLPEFKLENEGGCPYHVVLSFQTDDMRESRATMLDIACKKCSCP